jgi:hypothetical protein
VTARLTNHPEEARLAPEAADTGGREQSMRGNTVLRQALAPGLALVIAMGTAACTPTVRIVADQPITINLNVKIDQEVRVRLDKDLEDAIAKNPDLF